MPIRDRKLYIIKHNEFTDRENKKYEEMSSLNSNKTEAIDKFTDWSQNSQNASKNGNNAP